MTIWYNTEKGGDIVYKVCLVQNQNEMFHYEFADNRRMLKNINIDFIMYTSSNIEDLLIDIEDEEFDCIVLSTNSLNDLSICALIESEDFRIKLEKYLNKGKGLLIFSHLKFAEEEKAFTFLPKGYGTIRVKEKKNENSYSGDISIPEYYNDISIFAFPNRINIEEIKEKSANSKNIQGLYWHYLTSDDDNLWENIIVDNSCVPTRSLVLKSKRKNVIISSLLLDWQKHSELFYNFIVNSVSNENYVGIITTNEDNDISYKFLIETLNSNKMYTKIYDFEKDKNLLYSNIEANIHNFLILSPSITYDQLMKDNRIKDLSKGKDINILAMKNQNISNNFSMYGSRNSILKYQVDVEYFIQKELIGGYIENSFWKTVDILQVMYSLSDNFNDRYMSNKIKKTLLKIDEHNNNGSYDDTFGATCAKLWVLIHCDPSNSNSIDKTLEWIKNRLQSVNDYDYLMAYYYLDICNYEITETELISIRETLERVLCNNPNENAILISLKISRNLHFKDLLERSIKITLELSNDSFWLNHSTTASISRVLIDIYKSYSIQINGSLLNELERILFLSVHKLRKYIVSSFEKSVKFNIVSIVNSIDVCKEFEKIIDFPTEEILNIILAEDKTLKQSSININAVNILEDMRVKNNDLIREIDDLRGIIDDKSQKIASFNSIQKVKNKYLFRSKLFMSISLLFFYLIVNLLYFVIIKKDFVPFIQLVFGDLLLYQISLLPLIGVFGAIYKFVCKKDKE